MDCSRRGNMESVKSFLDHHTKKNLVIKECAECGGKAENYDLYIQGELKAEVRDDTCFTCQRKKEDEELKEKAIRFREEAKVNHFNSFSVKPLELSGVTFEDYQANNESQELALEKSLEFADENLDKTTLFFQGDTGLGKTHLSYCIHNHFIKNNKTSIFIDLPSLLSEIRNTYRDSNDYRRRTQDDIMKAIGDCELLVLDDIGAEYVKPDSNGYESWAADILFQISNSRLGKKNIYTTNFSSKDLNRKYGMMSKRIISRLMSNAQVLKMEGKDHRLKGLK